jgi:hypothetical protein
MITFTQGDTAILNLTAQDGDGNPIDITGATFTTSMVGAGGAIVEFPNSQHTANPDQVNFTGQFTLSLSDTDTPLVNIGFPKDILTLIVIGSSVIYYRGSGILAVQPPVPLR